MGKSLLTHFVMKHHWNEAGTRKKRPASRVFFFLPAFGRCCPSLIAHPANCIRCSSNIAIADHFPRNPFLSNTTWEARHGQLAEQFYLFIQTPLDRRGMASLQSNSTVHLLWMEWNGDRYYCAGKSLLTPFSMEHRLRSGNQTKKILKGKSVQWLLGKNSKRHNFTDTEWNHVLQRGVCSLKYK